MVYLLTAIGQPPGGSSTVHIYTQTIHRTTQNKQYIEQDTNQEECGPFPVFAGFSLAFALQLRKKHRKTSVRVSIHKYTIRIHNHNNKNIQITLLNRNKTIYTLIKIQNLKNVICGTDFMRLGLSCTDKNCCSVEH